MANDGTKRLLLRGGPLGQVEVDLYSWLAPDLTDGYGVEALEGILGFGLGPVANRWFEGAGAGLRWRGGKATARDFVFPLDLSQRDRGQLNELLRNLELLLSPSYAPATLLFNTYDGEEWSIQVVRESGGDYKRGVESDNETWIRLQDLTLRAGDPFWIRSRFDDFDVFASSGQPLLPEFAELKIASSQAAGTRPMVNSGTSESWPIWTLTGPASKLVLTNQDGAKIEWNGALSTQGNLSAGQSIIIDSEHSLVTDSAGVNRYGQLAPAPKFWPVLPGVDVATVLLEGVTPGVSGLRAIWAPRRWAMV